jgi:hypothetical protein
MIQLSSAKITFDIAKQPKQFFIAEACGHGYCKKMEEDRELLVKQVIESRGLAASAQESKAMMEQTCTSLSAELEDIRNQQQQDRINRLEAAERATKAASTLSPSSSPFKGHLETSSSSSSSSFAAFGMSEDEALRMADGILLGSEPAAQGGNKNQTLSGLNVLDETRYRDLIARLKRMLDAEKRVSRLARSQLATDLELRSEVEVFLRKAIEETRNEIAKKREALMIAAGQGDRGADKNLKAMPIGLSKQDREMLLSQLLQQDLVLLSLPSIVFPSRAGTHAVVDGGNGGNISGGKEGEAHKEGGHGSLKRSASTPH